jgi:hypothetical protein
MAASHLWMTPSEQMHFEGAPVAHVVLYYDWLRDRQRVRVLQTVSKRRHRQLIRSLAAARASSLTSDS